MSLLLRGLLIGFTGALVACGGGSDNGNGDNPPPSNPPPASEPAQFTFADVTAAPLSTLQLSNSITITGINTAVAINIVGGEYSIDGGGFTSSPGIINNNQQVVVRQTSAPNFSTTTTVTLTVGSVSDGFDVTTQAPPPDTTPDQFTLLDQSDVPLSSIRVSGGITISGINAPTAISISDGEYSIDGGAFTTAINTISNGQQVSVRRTSAATFSTTTDTILTVGSVSDTFSVTTLSTHPVVIEKELMITDLTVVESIHTQPGGKWTFEHLITEMMPQENPTDQEKSDFVLNWLSHWQSNQTVNGLVVPARNSIQFQVVTPWLNASDGATLDLSIAPFRLLAIVNRVDLAKRDAGGNIVSAGESRFVFGVLGSSGFPMQFTIIFEYGLPASSEQELNEWVQQWHSLGALEHSSVDPAYNDALVAITDRFTKKNADPSKTNGSALNQLRSNEIQLSSPWELREFQLFAIDGSLQQVTVKENPDFTTINNQQILADFINENEIEILGDAITLPDTFQGQPFLGGAALNNGGFGAIFRASGINNNEARHKLSLNTCSGCHGGETGTAFLHVFPRSIGQESGLSGFLRGSINGLPLTVSDPIDGTSRQFFDLDSRRRNLECLLNGC